MMTIGCGSERTTTHSYRTAGWHHAERGRIAPVPSVWPTSDRRSSYRLDEFGARLRVFDRNPYACRVGFREERVVRNEVAARQINEAIEETDTRPANSFIHVLCECGLEDCERVLAVTRPVYERVRSDPRQFVILPSHLISEVDDVVEESDGLLIVAKRRETPEDIAVRTDPRR